ncbi:MAG: DUF4143 domain-containing protein, partial [Desulfovibrionaceae bacterium]|nr:DUF4143 domain-containing protein [Desulfovibrionaceae bacterium]
PRARAAVKYLVADGRHDYVETGTTVSVKRHVRGIVIPSEERTLRLGPMDFGEFLQASGHDGLMELIRRAFETRRPLPDMLHRQIMRRLGDWLLVGGMPQAVSAFLEGGHGRDFAAARAAQRDILESCARDMAAWPGREAERVRAVYGSMPGQLGRSGSFRLNALGPNMRGRSLEDAFFWLEDAGMALVSTNNPAPGEPLFGHGLERTSVRLYLCDTGLLLARIYNEDKGVPQETLEMLLSGRTGELDGRLLENAAAQMLAASGHALRFHANASRTDRAARMRIDFLLERRGLSARRFSPVTVQKGRRQTLAPLAKFAARFGDRTDTAYHVREGNLRVQDGIVCLPLYMVPCL